MSPGLRLERAGGIATLTLARPDKLNALDAATIVALGQAADVIDDDPEMRVAILTGEGRAFCAGGDIAAWGGLEPLAMGQSWVRKGHQAFDRLARLNFQLGRGTSLDLVDAARQLRQAEIQLAVQEFNTVQAKIAALLALSDCNY